MDNCLRDNVRRVFGIDPAVWGNVKTAAQGTWADFEGLDVPEDMISDNMEIL
jgi:hypothetical protein